MNLINAFKEKNKIEKSVIIFILFYFVYLFYGFSIYVFNPILIINNFTTFTTFIKIIILFLLGIKFLIKLFKQSEDVKLWANLFFIMVILSLVMTFIFNILYIFLYSSKFNILIDFYLIFLISSIIIFIFYKININKNKTIKSIIPRRVIINIIIVLFFLSFTTFPGCSGDFANSRSFFATGFPLTLIETNVDGRVFLGDDLMGNTHRYNHDLNLFIYSLLYNVFFLVLSFFIITLFLKKSMNRGYLNGFKCVGWYVIIASIASNIVFFNLEFGYSISFIISLIIYFPAVIIGFLSSIIGLSLISGIPLLKLSFFIGMIIFFLIGYLTTKNKVKEANKNKIKDAKNKSSL